MSPTEFSRWTDNTEGVANIVCITNGVGQTILGSPYAIHHGNPNTLFVPSWMIRELDLDNEHCRLERVEPSMCTGLTLQPHTSEHLSAEDPQELLRDAFEQYSCLTPGTTVPLWIETHQITVTIVQLSPTPNTTLCIRNCELTLDLLRPLDMPDVEDTGPDVGNIVHAGAGVPAFPAFPAFPAVNAVAAATDIPAIATPAIDHVARRALMAAAARRRLQKIEAE